MNKYKILSTFVASLFLFSGCYDLDRVPSDKLDSGNFFKTQDHADQAMMGVYNAMQYNDAFGEQFSMDCLGGIGMGYDPASYAVVQRGTYDVKEGTVLNKYKTFYEGIARANIVLQNINKCEMSSELIAQYTGEAKFMRGLFYFALLDFFGGVPIYDESIVIADNFNNLTEPRSSAEEVRSFILKDLDAAIASLPAQWNDANKGRATSGAATALKGKVLLFNKQYAEAAACFEAVVNSGNYALYNSYENLFKPGGDDSNEMIFAIQNMGGVGTDIGMPMTFYMGTRASFGSCWNNVMAATDFVDSYEWKDGRPFDWEEVVPGYTTDDKIKDATFRADVEKKSIVKAYPEAKDKLLEMYDQRDPRMAASIILPYTMYKGWYSNAPMDCEYVIGKEGQDDGHGLIRVNGNYENYLWRKFVAEYDMDGAINNREDTPINFPLIRYADVLLMLAECDNELGKQAEAVALINQVRARVNMPGLNSGPAWLSANSKDEVFQRIKHERAVELAAEGHSFSDMRRWGLLETLNGKDEKGFTGKTYYTRVVKSRDYLWPIPANEIEKNTALTQNPGW